MSMKDILLIALPWVFLALVFAALFFLDKRRKNKGAKEADRQDGEGAAPPENRSLEGMCVGAALGLSLGSALGAPKFCALLGLGLGFFIGSNIKKDSGKAG